MIKKNTTYTALFHKIPLSKEYPLTYHYGDKLLFTRNSFIDTDLSLFTPENLDQDFTISLKVNTFDYTKDKQATILSSMDES